MNEILDTPKRKFNSTYVIGIVVILGFMAFAIPGLKQSMRTYVERISEVKTKYAGQTIQVRGELLKNEITYDKSSAMIFYIKDDTGEKLKCRYKGPRPGNLDQAPWIVVVGSYQNDIFQAESLICKCPDKYEGEQK